MTAPARVVLLHGAWHRGSSWAPVVAELERAGVPVAAPDLPADVPGAGHEQQVAPALAAAGDDGPVVLVAHSLAGLVTPVAADRIGVDRVRALVLVGALVPDPGRAHRDRMREEPPPMVPGFDAGVRRGDGMITYWPDAEAAAASLYRGVADEIDQAADGTGGGRGAAVVAAEVAAMRPQDWTVLREPCPLDAWPAVRTVSVLCRDDRVVDPGTGRRESERIGAEIVELPGGHFPALTRPRELAGLLRELAERDVRSGA